MVDIDSENVEKAMKVLSRMSKDTAMVMAQQMLIPHILNIFQEHDHNEVKRMILSNYPLVEKELPDNVEQALRNLGSNDQLRGRWEDVVVTYLTPDNILKWLHNPAEWSDEELPEEHRRELEYCAVVIEDTRGGREWLERQIEQLYKYAGIIPEETTVVEADD